MHISKDSVILLSLRTHHLELLYIFVFQHNLQNYVILERGVLEEKAVCVEHFSTEADRMNQQASGQTFMSPEMESLANCVDWLLALVGVSVINMSAPYTAPRKKRGVA